MKYKPHKLSRGITERPAKAGVLLMETDDTGARRFVVPFNEGRFSREGRYFVLPKGSVDYKEEVAPGARYDSSPIAGGIRETSEETGLPLGIILGKENIRRLEHGETLHNITHPDFPGFEILKAIPKAYPHMYHARGGKEQTMVMYGFKVKGLDTLKPYLKNCDGKTTKDFLDERPDMPRFPTFLKWMKQGFIPASGDLPEVKLFEPDWFEATVKRLAPDGVEMPDNWQGTRDKWEAFCASLDKKELKPERVEFRKCFSLIKKRLLDEGWIKGDLDVLKFDEKDCPLFYYTEGGVIEDEKTVISKTLHDMVNNVDYARAFGGKGTRIEGLNAMSTIVLGQVAAYSSFVKPSIWRAALTETMEQAGRVAHHLVRYGRHTRDCAVTRLVPEPASAQTAR